MAASDHLQPEQLRMFAPASEILDTHALADARWQGPVSRSKMLQTKTRENERYGKPDMGEPIQIHHGSNYGIEWPGSRGRPVVYDGHHRLAEGLRTDSFVALQHTDERNYYTLDTPRQRELRQ